MRNYRTEAIQNIPRGYYILSVAQSLRPDDLVWSWPTKEFLRADSSEWLRSPLMDSAEDVVCAVRKVTVSEFAENVPKQRVFRF